MAPRIHDVYGQMFRHWRRRRFALFVRLVKPRTSDTLLDVGGDPRSWTLHPQPVERIDTLNVRASDWTNAGHPDHNIRTLIGDACSLPMPDACYDIGFSNSVIEHVGSWERQQQFARELRRVARRLWVQTPAYECPIEPHYLTPFVHYLPRSLQKRILRRGTLWGWVANPTREQIASVVDTTRLLRKSEMRELFPDCTILTERMLWVIPKAHIAVRAEA